MSPTLIRDLSGVSGFIGLISLAIHYYFHFSLKVSEAAAKHSISQIVGGEQRFNADQILKILALFKNDQKSRLEALKVLTEYDDVSVARLLTKIEGNIDVRKIEAATSKSGRQFVLRFGIVVLILSGLALAFALSREGTDQGGPNPPPPPVPVPSAKPVTPLASPKPVTPLPSPNLTPPMASPKPIPSAQWYEPSCHKDGNNIPTRKGSYEVVIEWDLHDYQNAMVERQNLSNAHKEIDFKLWQIDLSSYAISVTDDVEEKFAKCVAGVAQNLGLKGLKDAQAWQWPKFDRKPFSHPDYEPHPVP